MRATLANSLVYLLVCGRPPPPATAIVLVLLLLQQIYSTLPIWKQLRHYTSLPYSGVDLLIIQQRSSSQQWHGGGAPGSATHRCPPQMTRAPTHVLQIMHMPCTSSPLPSKTAPGRPSHSTSYTPPCCCCCYCCTWPARWLQQRPQPRSVSTTSVGCGGTPRPRARAFYGTASTATSRHRY